MFDSDQQFYSALVVVGKAKSLLELSGALAQDIALTSDMRQGPNIIKLFTVVIGEFC